MMALIASAAAQVPGPPSPADLAQFPALQFISAAAVVGIFIVGALIWLRSQDRGSSAKQTVETAASAATQPAAGSIGTGGWQIYLDGPVQKFLIDWERLAQAFERLADGVGNSAALRIEFDEQIDRTRHSIANIAQAAGGDALIALKVTDDRLSGLIKGLDERVRRIEDAVHRMELDQRTDKAALSQMGRELDGLRAAMMNRPDHPGGAGRAPSRR